SPLLAEAHAAVHVLLEHPRCNGDCEDYIAPGRWRTEARPASLPMMLEHSIDLNVPNLWWIRMKYEPVSSRTRIVSSALAGTMFVVALIAGYSLWASVTANSRSSR